MASTRTIIKLGSIILVTMLLITTIGGAVGSAMPGTVQTDIDKRTIETSALDSDEGSESLPGKIYTNMAHAPSNFGDIYASTSIGSWFAT